MTADEKLLEKIGTKKAVIGVIGLGYVGLPLALLFARRGFVVHGFTRTPKTISEINSGITEISGLEKDLNRVLKNKHFSAHPIDDKQLLKCDIYIICVPTPVNPEKKPDLTSLKEVVKKLKQIGLKGKLVINESTVAPFTTRDVFKNVAEDFFLVCSPERVDPGVTTKTAENIPKLLGARDKKSQKLGIRLYRHIMKKDLVVTGSMEAAEMSKMLENTYRAVNIALINEFAILADKVDIDIMDVLNAAKTKWSFQAHNPGIGVGGHCIPVDPYYILELAEKNNLSLPVILTSLLQNESMPKYLLDKLLTVYKPGMRVLVYGIAYKKNVADIRESPVIEFCRLMTEHKIPFEVHEPLINSQTLKTLGLKEGALSPVDIFIVGTDHRQILKDYKSAVTNNTFVLDGRNYFKKAVGKKVIGVGHTILKRRTKE